MKKVLVIFIVGFVFLGCSAQNADAQSSNDAQRIIGTWKNVNDGFGEYTIVFNQNGTFTITGIRGPVSGEYFISGSQIIFKANNSIHISNYHISTNGRELVFTFTLGPFDGGWRWASKQ